MAAKRRQYRGEAIDVTFMAGRCIHAAECVRRLPAVFNTRRRPWVVPDASPVGDVAHIVERCPSGALQYVRRDGGPAERIPAVTVARPQRDGPLYLRGHLSLKGPAGSEQVSVETRLALCRCGASANKPFCDNSHLRSGFDDSGALAARPARRAAPDRSGPVTIEPRPNGPYSLRGPIDIIGADGLATVRVDRVLLCRCGHSGSKPFCDGSHEGAGFRAD